MKRTSITELRDLMAGGVNMALEIVKETPEHRAVILPVYIEALRLAEVFDEQMAKQKTPDVDLQDKIDETI